MGCSKAYEQNICADAVEKRALNGSIGRNDLNSEVPIWDSRGESFAGFRKGVDRRDLGVGISLKNILIRCMATGQKKSINNVRRLEVGSTRNS